MVEPDYQELLARDIPSVTRDGVTVTVIAGRALGIESPVRTAYTPTSYLDFRLEPGAIATQHIQRGWNAFIYVLSGSGVFGADAPAAGATAVTGGVHSPEHHTLVLSNRDGATAAAGGDATFEDGVVVQAGPEGVRFVLIAGCPTKEPVLQYGPFVLTTAEEVEQAFDDYRGDRNGFEGARAWTSAWSARHPAFADDDD
jgi:quercetin 2,3-dioxygenase